MVTGAVDAARRLLGPAARTDWPIGPLTTYRVGGAAALFLEISGAADLERARQATREVGLPVLVLGRGSNLLVADAGFPGLVVSLGADYSKVHRSAATLRAGAAVNLPVLARKTAALGLTGLEWAVGVPGSVGGAVRMNAGGHGSDTSTVLTRWAFVDLKGGADGERPASALGFGYRRSAVEPAHVVTWAEYELEPGDVEASEATIREIVRWRRENQPGGQNAGSVFTNPSGDSAGRLIEQAGLKGYRVGSARVSDKHANFVQADAGGSADDVRALIDQIRAAVESRLGVALETELRIVGGSSQPLAQRERRD